MNFRGRRTRFLSLLSAFLILLAIWAAPVSALENAYGFDYDPNRGVYSAIETADPTIRGSISTEWSYMRVLVQRIIDGNVYYAEIGWLKGYRAGSTPRVYWTTRDRWGVVEEGVYWDWAPAVGVTYNYEVRHTQLDTWGLYFNGTNVKSAVVGWETADDWGSGGETPNGNQGMGSSNNNNVQYLDPNGNWYSGAGYQVFNTRPDLYHVDAGANTSSWRVWGNN